MGANKNAIASIQHTLQTVSKGKSGCVSGTYTTTAGLHKPKEQGFTEGRWIYYGRTFSKTPKVVASVSGFLREGYTSADTYWGVKVEAKSVYTNKFYLYTQGIHTKITKLSVTWTACGE